MDKRIWNRKHWLGSVCLILGIFLPVIGRAQGFALRSDAGTYGPTEYGINVSNQIASATSGKKVVLGAGILNGGSNAIWFAEGVSVSGLGPQVTRVDVYGTDAQNTTNGGAFYLPDNASVSDLFLNQTNPEQFVIAPIGTQRKNQTSPAQTAANLAATSTNVVLERIVAYGKKLQCVIIDCTNVFNWTIRHSDLRAELACPLTLGLTIAGGESAGALPCTNSLSYIKVVDTSLSVVGGNGSGASPLAGAYINFSGTALLSINNVTIYRTNATAVAAGFLIAGTGSTNDISVNGKISFIGTVGNTNAYDVYISGTNNVVILRQGITNVYDVGLSNQIIWAATPPPLSPLGNLIGQSISNILVPDTNSFVSYGSAAAANKTWFWNSAMSAWTNSSNARFVTNNPSSGQYEMYNGASLRQHHGTLFGQWAGDAEAAAVVAPIILDVTHALVGTTTLVNTNFSGGVLYTNGYGGNIMVIGSIALTSAVVAGMAAMHLEIAGVTTNNFTVATPTLAGNFTNTISGIVPPGGTYVFTNRSVGLGNSAGIIGGQILIH